MSRVVLILTYHSLDESRSVISTSPAIFRRQIEALHARGFSGISLGALLRGWHQGEALPERPVVVTFDDGFGNVLDQAAPVLREHDFGATLFAVAAYCGKTNDWPGQSSKVPRLPLLSSSGLKEWCDAGFELGSHTSTHPNLARCSDELAEREIADSRKMLEDQIGHPVSTFAYPYGTISRTARKIVAKTYAGACGVEHRKARRRDDPHQLPRIDTFYVRNPWLSDMLGGGLVDMYLGARGAGRAIRGMLIGGGSAHDLASSDRK